MTFLEIEIIENTFNVQELLSVLAAVGTIGTATGVIGAGVKHFRTINTIKQTTDNLLIIELRDSLNALKPNPKYDIEFNILEGEKLRRTNVFLNHDVYDSLVYSGEYVKISVDLQQHLQDVYQIIKQRNEYYEKILKIEDEQLLKNEELDFKITGKYFVIIDKIERNLLEQIPIMIDCLKNKPTLGKKTKNLFLWIPNKIKTH